jgi:hypothetical protein
LSLKPQALADAADLSETILEINDLQKASLDNQPLAQTTLEINDLRWIATHPPPPRLWRTGSRENAQKPQKAGLGSTWVRPANHWPPTTNP